ncbi:LysR family transcriptional regulator [Salmonella enterica subsp. enterica]|nr:LysR family transcriptional regulator [Salmonella enterica subsp. enterica]EDT7315838.1 LysR family transcriptional regulator [Salmonella enterica subsp. enterica]
MFFSRHISYFMKFIETGSVLKAAEALFITPSAVRSSLTALENNYGKKLLKREKRGLTPTAAGNQLYEDLLPVYESVVSIMNRHGIKNNHKKNLKVYIEGIYYPDIPTKMNRTMNHFNIQIELLQSSCSCFEELTNHNCDLAIYSSLEKDDNLSHDFYKVHLSQENIGALLSRKLLAKFGSVYSSIINTKLIQQNVFLSLSLHKDIENKLKSQGVEATFIGMPEIADVLSLIQEGVGVTLISESILNFSLINEDDFIFVNDPFSFPLTVNRDIFFRKENFKNLIEIANFIVEQGTPKAEI